RCRGGDGRVEPVAAVAGGQGVPLVPADPLRDGQARNGGERPARDRVPGRRLHDPGVQAAVAEGGLHVRNHLALPLATAAVGYNASMDTVSLQDLAKDPSLLDRVAAGESLVVSRGGRPVAELRPLTAPTTGLRPVGL